MATPGGVFVQMQANEPATRFEARLNSWREPGSRLRQEAAPANAFQCNPKQNQCVPVNDFTVAQGQPVFDSLLSCEAYCGAVTGFAVTN